MKLLKYADTDSSLDNSNQNTAEISEKEDAQREKKPDTDIKSDEEGGKISLTSKHNPGGNENGGDNGPQEESSNVTNPVRC